MFETFKSLSETRSIKLIIQNPQSFDNMSWLSCHSSILSSQQHLMSDFFTQLGKRTKTVNLVAFENSLVKLSNKAKTLIFDKEVQFSLQNQVIIIAGKCFKINEETTLEKWLQYFLKRITHIGFHEHFAVMSLIGKGAQASVYHARKHFDMKDYAIKAFSKRFYERLSYGQNAIYKEIKCLKALNHQNIQKFEGVYETENTIYLSLEYLKGGSLKERISEIRHQLFQNQEENIKTVLRGILNGIILGLDHIHKRRMMHRDLKLENIIFRNESYDSAVIIDFGYAQEIDESPYIIKRCGTPGFIAPEIFDENQGNYGPQCDLFSVGAIFYQLLTGNKLFNEKGVDQLLQQNSEAIVDFDVKELSHASVSAIDLLKRMLKKNPSERITAEQALRHEYLLEEEEGSEIACFDDEEGPGNQLQELNKNGLSSLDIQTFELKMRGHSSAQIMLTDRARKHENSRISSDPS